MGCFFCFRTRFDYHWGDSGMKTRVMIGDLRYYHAGILANDCMPLGVAYLKAVMDAETPEIDSRIYVYPDKLLAAMKAQAPDVLMLTNYVWNEALSCEFFRIAKQLNPNVLTVMGGPNIPIEPERQQMFMERYPQIDLYVLGEGDFLANTIVQRFIGVGHSLKGFKELDIASTALRRPDGSVIVTKVEPRHREISEIPSPWLTGIQDEFFDGRLAPMIETNRGCPFTCTYCVQGTSWYTKVHNFPIERMREEIQYIARRIHTHSPNMGTLRIADSNYGMFERDIEISGYIGEMQRDYGWPTFIDATTGKNRPERIIKSVEQVNGALVLYQAVQSLDEDVLRAVKRQTIKLDAYKALEVHMRGRGLRSISDLILGLPGESLESHLTGLKTLLNSNIDQRHNFQAMLLKGSEMEKQDSRDTFKFVSRFRVLPKNFGEFDEHRIADVEEIVVATDTLPFEDYITCRKWHLVSSVFWNDGWFDVVVKFCRENGIQNSDWWELMLPAMEEGTPAVRAFLDSFVGETKSELFEDRDECAAFYMQPGNFEKLERGEIGDNLMYRYRAIASFFEWDEICATAMGATARMLKERGVAQTIDNFDQFWADFTTFIRLRHASGSTEEQILAPASAELHYDFPAWTRRAVLGSPQAYRLPEAEEFEFALTEEGRSEMQSALKVWTTHIRGLSKLVTRIRMDAQIRSCTRISAPLRSLDVLAVA